MPRKPRIELVGKYHIINRGVAHKKGGVENTPYSLNLWTTLQFK